MKARLLSFALTLLAAAAPSQAFELESLLGSTYHQSCKDCEGWTGLPAGVSDTWGSLIDEGIGLPQFFGVQGFQTSDGRSFLTFDLISNFADGRAYNRILGVLETSGTAVMFCGENGGPQIIAVMTPAEYAQVRSQPINAPEGILATLNNPVNAYRMNRRSLRIEKIDGSGLRCVGFPHGG